MAVAMATRLAVTNPATAQRRQGRQSPNRVRRAYSKRVYSKRVYHERIKRGIDRRERRPGLGRGGEFIRRTLRLLRVNESDRAVGAQPPGRCGVGKGYGRGLKVSPKLVPSQSRQGWAYLRGET